MIADEHSALKRHCSVDWGNLKSLVIVSRNVMMVLMMMIMVMMMVVMAIVMVMVMMVHLKARPGAILCCKENGCVALHCASYHLHFIIV